jgi:putative transposase
MDYSRPGKYFVTICTAQKMVWFGSVINSKMHLSEIEHIASQMWYKIPVHFLFIGLDAFVVMPYHLHGIIIINQGVLHETALHPHDDQIKESAINVRTQ